MCLVSANTTSPVIYARTYIDRQYTMCIVTLATLLMHCGTTITGIKVLTLTKRTNASLLGDKSVGPVSSINLSVPSLPATLTLLPGCLVWSRQPGAVIEGNLTA